MSTTSLMISVELLEQINQQLRQQIAHRAAAEQVRVQSFARRLQLTAFSLSVVLCATAAGVLSTWH